ncbi:MAG: hypothetical protein ACTSV5_02085 [Promethearchaeota archaeon]
MNFVCSCCYCCCGSIVNLKRLLNPSDFTTNNYYAEIDKDLYTGCGNCIDRCQMDAIILENDISSIEKKRCIVCGNYALECLSDAITLRKKDKQKIPPLNVEELYKNYIRIFGKKERDLNHDFFQRSSYHILLKSKFILAKPKFFLHCFNIILQTLI